MDKTYDIVFSVGTSVYDESRYVLRNIPASQLASRIISLQSKGKTIYSVTLNK